MIIIGARIPNQFSAVGSREPWAAREREHQGGTKNRIYVFLSSLRSFRRVDSSLKLLEREKETRSSDDITMPVPLQVVWRRFPEFSVQTFTVITQSGSALTLKPSLQPQPHQKNPPETSVTGIHDSFYFFFLRAYLRNGSCVDERLTVWLCSWLISLVRAKLSRASLKNASKSNFRRLRTRAIMSAAFCTSLRWKHDRASSYYYWNSLLMEFI